MIECYVTDIAAEMGIHLSKVTVIEGQTIGCYDVFLLHIISGRHLVNTLVFQSELEDLQRDLTCDRLDVKIRIALLRLKTLSDLDF